VFFEYLKPSDSKGKIREGIINTTAMKVETHIFLLIGLPQVVPNRIPRIKLYPVFPNASWIQFPNDYLSHES
jgi:hypothetical protein